MDVATEPDGPAPVVREVETVRRKAEHLSSRILDRMRLKGRTSQAGSSIGDCGDDYDPDTHFSIGHHWSLAHTSEAELERAFDGLPVALPKDGWKVLSVGPDEHTQARVPTLKAEYVHGEDIFTVTIRIQKRWGENDPDDPRLLVSLGSTCYRVPPGEEVTDY
ncbi:hypothetical protein ACFQLX_09135 [Streptomyces polyrhachis]|uniref:Uncharacterized protein n=1 Tax=Streptomyces polyrhachis TaxID=1282885 RepID=A0ABW2GE49_9ACTN